jgi:hypothetical protein
LPHISKDWDKALGVTTTLTQQLHEKETAEAIEFGVQSVNVEAEQARQLAEVNIDFLAGLSIPDIYKYPHPPVLIAAWQLITRAAREKQKFTQLALGIPRGHGKTTFIKLFILWCILFTDKKFILIIAATADRAQDILSDIEGMLDERNIKSVFGDWTIGVEKNAYEVKKFSYRGRPIVIAALGAGGAVRGMNVNNERPDIIVFDDIQTKECSESRIQSEGLERWMIGTAMKAKSPAGCLFIFAGNMYPGPNSILKKLKSNPTWTKFISGAILADGTALWEDLRSFNSLVEELDNDIAMGHPEIFFSEVMNDTEAGINSNTDLSKIKPWAWNPWEKPQGKFIVIDPSAGKKGGDAVAIGYFEVYDGKVGFRGLIEKNLSPGNTIRTALLMALEHKVRLIAVESVGYQATLAYWFKIIADELNLTGFHFVEIHSGSNSKNARIVQALKGLTAGEVILHPDVVNFVTHQIANWNPMKRDNEDGILDVLTYGPKVMEKFGPLALSYEEELLMEDATPGVLEHNSSF